ncbi:MAG TPA: ATP-binding protein [Terriglobia bacterium]|nr:ATP-binding protein [Terriglobia bacterium]
MMFRLKLLLAMMVLVIGVTATTLVITESQVRRSYERHFEQLFQFQVDSFLQQRQARLQPVQERLAVVSTNPRLLAAMENAGQARPEQRDIDDLYQNAIDQLSEVLAAYRDNRTNGPHAFYCFLNGRGEVLYPSASIRLPFSISALPGIAKQVETVGAAVARDKAVQVGYLASKDDPARASVREVIFIPIIDQVDHQNWGVLAVAFPLAVSKQSSLLSALWLDGRLYSSSLPANSLGDIEGLIQSGLSAGPPTHNLSVRIGDVPHLVYCQPLVTGPAFPPAYQVCLYSLAEANLENQHFKQRIVGFGTFALVCAFALSWWISRSLTVPLQELVTGTTQIEAGNYSAKVPVRRADEIGRLARSFNAMSERVQATHASLEQRIAERTHELAERKRAEEALRKSEASLREAQRIAQLGNWEWDVPANRLRWSDEIYSIFGVKPGEFRATHQAFLERVHPADLEKVEEAVRRSLETAQPYSLEHRVLRPDGGVRIVRQQAELSRDSSGGVQRMIGTVQDITEQKRIEAEFLRAQRMDSIGALAGGMAHDLNNALSPILMGIQLIRNKVPDPGTQKLLTVMEQNTYRGADMVRQVLTFARGRDGERELLDVARLLHEMENIMRQTLPKSISVQAMVPPDLWPVRGNSTQLHQVLLNLCVNARDAMPSGGALTLAADNVELGEAEAKEIREATPGAYVMLLVSDSGTGIPPEVMPRIFDAFFTTKEPGKGTGLGLSTSSRIVRSHGGAIGLKSEVGAGTTFEIYLPRAEQGPQTALPATPTLAEASGRGELILFVDDDRSVREMVGPALMEHGYGVVSAANGAEALAVHNQHEREIRLILTDMAMPVMDGTDMLSILHRRNPQLPMVVMSGTYNPEKEALPPGVVAFLAKPFRLEQLLGVIADTIHPKAQKS